ncbi:MAG: carboxypeptidase-like regulatory domain-containing protein [Acidobacteriota bacterium]
MIGPVLFAALFAGTVAPASEVLPLPFDFHLSEAGRARFEDLAVRRPPAGVSVLVQSPGSAEDRVDVFQERPGEFPRWEWKDAAVGNAGAARLEATGDRRSLLVWRRPGTAGYRVSAVIRWPSDQVVLEVSALPARFLAGTEDGNRRGGDFRLLSSRNQPDPLCERGIGGRWQCLGVRADVTAILMVCSPGNEARFAEIRPGGPAETRLESDGWATGILVDRSEIPRPVLSASITFSLVSPGAAAGQTTTQRTLPALPLGESLFWVHGPLAADAQLVAREAGGSGRALIEELVGKSCAEPVRLALQPPRILRGSVVDGSGKPLAGSSVLALEPRKPAAGNDVARGPVLVTSTVADDRGDYVFIELDPQVKRLRACHARTGCLEKDVPPSSEVVDFRLLPKWLYTGRAVSQSGVPIAEAHLRFVPLPEEYARATDRLLLLSPETDAVTDSSGLFEISAPAPASYFLEARSAGIGTARRRIDVTPFTGSETKLEDLVLKGAGEFLAILLGTGCPGGSLDLLGPIDAGSAPGLKEFPFDAEGRARVDLPEGGMWLAQARCAEGLRPVAPEVLTSAQDVYGQEVRFTLQNPAPEKRREKRD